MVKDLGKLAESFGRFLPKAIEKISGGKLKNLPRIEGENVYHLFRQVDYSYNFCIDKDGKTWFKIQAISDKRGKNIDLNLINLRISNRAVNESRYLSNRKILKNGESIKVRCRIKRFPGDILSDDLNDKLFGYVVKELYRAIVLIDST